jgi:hypothetical protein
MAKMFRTAGRNDTSVAANTVDRHEHLDCTATQPKQRELARRHNDGVDVALFWHTATDELLVCVWDQRSDVRFELHPEPYMALEFYYHPYAHLASEQDALLAS